jgi:pimeloyl-ACP methyl ester carboxylesterase
VTVTCLGLVALTLAKAGTVVMVHGAGGGGWEYDFWKPVFASEGWQVVARDLMPAKGGLAKTTFDDYASQVESWGKGARRPLVLVGASMGGPLALRAAARLNPDLIVLVDSVAPADVSVGPKAQAFPDVVQWANGPLKDTVDAMPDSDEKTVHWAWKKWRDESGAVMNELVKGAMTAKPRCPVLVVWGEKDTDVPLSTGLALASAYGADLRVYAGTSHVGPLMGRRAKEIAGDVLGWVGRRLGQ